MSNRVTTMFVALGPFLLLSCLLAGCAEAPQEAAVESQPAPPEASRSVPRPAEPFWQAEYEEMVAATSMPPSQQETLRQAFVQSYGELERAMAGEEGEKLVAEEQALREAAESRDLAAVRRITRQDKTQRQAFREKIGAKEDEILAVLTPAQHLQWDAHRISKELISLAGPGLSEEQKGGIRGQAASFLQGAANRGEPNPMAAAFMDMEQWAEANVFTPEQRAAYQSVKQRHPLRSLKW